MRRASEVSNERFVKIKHEQDVLRVSVMTEGTKICDRSFRAEERWEKLPKKTSNRSLPRHQSEDSKVHLQNLFANRHFYNWVYILFGGLVTSLVWQRYCLDSHLFYFKWKELFCWAKQNKIDQNRLRIGGDISFCALLKKGQCYCYKVSHSW